MGDAEGEGPVSCTMCGLTVQERPATWSMVVSDRARTRGVRWVCETCTRQNLRSIEGKLDEALW